MMKKQASFVIFCWMLAGLTSCNLPATAGSALVGQEVSHQYRTVSAMLTQTAGVGPESSTILPVLTQVATQTPLPVLLSTPLITPSFTVAATRVAGMAISQITPTHCDQAAPGRPIDITVPDDSLMQPGQSFSKTWRLINVGSCSWTPGFAAVWFSGDDLGVNHEQAFSVNVIPGQPLDITIDMIAPQAPGAYQSNWKLRDQDGNLFGIGPNGDAPFWVRIVVAPEDTVTVTPTPTMFIPSPTVTKTPGVFLSSTLSLDLGDQVDLDSGMLNQINTDDIAYQRSAEEHQLLAPVNGAQLIPFGVTMPQLADCLNSALADSPVPMEQLNAGSYFCYRTNDGLPGRLSIKALDAEKGQLTLDFLTWSVP